jgi:hypothetical protein
MLSSTTIARAVQRLDAWRRPLGSPATELSSYKEWLHFCVRLPELAHGHLLINVSFTERRLPRGTACTPRVLALACADGWVGRFDAFGADAVSAPSGGLDVRLGDTRVWWSDGAYRIELQAECVCAELTLRPLMLPTVKSSVSLAPAHAMHWVAVPRLTADGWVQIDGRRVRLAGAPAYHDHNWGHFRWGRDLCWEWGFVHPTDPTCPWTVLFVRIADGLRHNTLSQGVLVWKGDSHIRTFQNQEISVTSTGSLVQARPLTLPAAMALLVPGAASGVPAQLEVRAAGLGEEIAIRFEPTSFARVAMPSDVDELGSVLINETTGNAEVVGRTRAGNFELTGSAVVEFVRG